MAKVYDFFNLTAEEKRLIASGRRRIKYIMRHCPYPHGSLLDFSVYFEPFVIRYMRFSRRGSPFARQKLLDRLRRAVAFLKESTCEELFWQIDAYQYGFIANIF